MSLKFKLDSVEDLLAHSLTLETEAGERYRELADAMEVHNNPEVCALFRTLQSYAQKHAAEMNNRAKDLNLPHISPWDYIWSEEDSPEAADIFQTHYKMTPYHVIQIAMSVEKGACDFYSKIALHSMEPAVKAMAEEFAKEEEEHVRLLEEWVARYPKPDLHWDEDLDPPMMHE